MNRIDLPHLVWTLESLVDGRVVNPIKVDEDVARVRLERDRMIRDVVAGGGSYREVARTLGLSHSRIQQIVNSTSK
jgi:hypothetical protein